MRYVETLEAADPQQEFINTCGKRYTEMTPDEQKACREKLANNLKTAVKSAQEAKAKEPKKPRKTVKPPARKDRFKKAVESDQPPSWYLPYEEETNYTPVIVAGGAVVMGLVGFAVYKLMIQKKDKYETPEVMAGLGAASLKCLQKCSKGHRSESKGYYGCLDVCMD